MNKIFKIVLAALLINTIFISTVLADPMSDQLQNQQSKLTQDKNSLKTIQTKKDAIEVNIESLDNQIEAQMSKIAENKNLVAKKQVEIKNTELEIKKIDIDIVNDEELYNNRIRSMYINGNDSYISILASSKGVSDFISRVDTIKKLTELDKKIIKELNDKKSESNNKKEALNNENKKLLELNSQNELALTKLNSFIGDQKNMIVELNSKEFALSSTVNSSQAAINTTLKQIADIRKAAPKTVVSRGATIISDSNVIAYASNFMGTPYLWGGTSPSGFDCSGFTQYVYAHFGVSIGRTTYDQITNGVGVARGDLQAGDLVFFGTNGPTHVGMYVGNGTYINAPRTGDVIKIASVNRSDYITARRVK